MLAGLSTYSFKKRFQQILIPVQNFLIAHEFSPNQITVATTIMSLVTTTTLFFLPQGSLLGLLLLFAFFLRMAFNALDGMVARETNSSTKKGAVLNEVTDYLCDSYLVLALAIYTSEGFVLWGIFGFLMMTSEFFSSLQFSNPFGERNNSGPMAKSDRSVFFGLCLIASFSPAESYWLEALLLVGCFFAGLTCFNRLKWAMKIRD